jgi:hypothetical protein
MTSWRRMRSRSAPGRGSGRAHPARPRQQIVSLGALFRLQLAESVIFQQGALNLIVGASPARLPAQTVHISCPSTSGPTGCGKSALLLALLGELHTGPDARVSLPRAAGVAYAAQEAFLLSETSAKTSCLEMRSTRRGTRKVSSSRHLYEMELIRGA